LLALYRYLATGMREERRYLNRLQIHGSREVMRILDSPALEMIELCGGLADPQRQRRHTSEHYARKPAPRFHDRTPFLAMTAKAIMAIAAPNGPLRLTGTTSPTIGRRKTARKFVVR